MSEKWTKGDWIAVGAYVELDDENRPDICTCEPKEFLQYGKRTQEEIRANARLIAAAPDIYVALKGIYDMLYAASDGERIWTMEMQQSARYALAKARGES